MKQLLAVGAGIIAGLLLVANSNLGSGSEFLVIDFATTILFRLGGFFTPFLLLTSRLRRSSGVVALFSLCMGMTMILVVGGYSLEHYTPPNLHADVESVHNSHDAMVVPPEYAKNVWSLNSFLYAVPLLVVVLLEFGQRRALVGAISMGAAFLFYQLLLFWNPWFPDTVSAAEVSTQDLVGARLGAALGVILATPAFCAAIHEWIWGKKVS